MSTNRYIQDCLLKERQQERLQEAERQRCAVQAMQSSPHHGGLRHMIGRSGALLVALGTRMERIEQRKPVFASGGKASLSGHLH